MQRVNLNVAGKQSSGGIRDDESLLCPTPPNKEFAGVEFQGQDFNNNNIKFYQPISFTVNVNQAGPNPMVQPYFGTGIN